MATKNKRVDYMVDGGELEEEFFNTKRDALKRAQALANERRQKVYVYRWARGACNDFEIDEGGTVEVLPQNKSKC